MTHEHLLSQEIDLLLDGDEGFATHPLRKHLEACGECRASLERARAVNAMLERLPHASPRTDFATSVMARVNVFEPWYVSVADTVKQAIPQSGPWRIAAGVGLGGAAISVSALAVWVALRLDLAIYALHLAGTRLQAAAINTGSALVSSVFGESALSMVRDGSTSALLMAATVFVGSLAAATFGLRRLLISSHRRGN